MTTELTPLGSELLAYTDRITYSAGESLQLRANGDGPVDIDLVQLLHPPDDPDWSTPCVRPVPSVSTLRIDLEPRETFGGSYLSARVDALSPSSALSGSLYLCPTRLDVEAVQGLVSLHDAGTAAGVSVRVEQGRPILCWSGEDGPGLRLASPVPLVQDRWQIVSWSIDPGTGDAALAHRLVVPAPGTVGRWSGSDRFAAPPQHRMVDVLVGAARLASAPLASVVPGAPSPGTCFNGKIDSPVLVVGSVEPDQLAALDPEVLAGIRPLLSRWDFSQDQSGATVLDTGPHGHHGVLVNAPTRAVTGVHWRGNEQNWVHAPEQYTAVHLHDDDLDDVRWPVVATVDLPSDLACGVYAVRVRDRSAETETDGEMVTVVVASRSRRPEVRTVVVLPTYTYIAYANLLGNGEKVDYVRSGLAAGTVEPHEKMRRLSRLPVIGGSLYDVHSDGSGRCYSSPRRPILNLRVDWKSGARDAYRHLAADLYLLQWLESCDVPFDVITDHLLDETGAAALEGYDTVLTGSHPEYVSRTMIEAWQSHLDTGGSLLYLGGNGFYWVTTGSPQLAELIEVRRGFTGTRTWTGAPGESHHSMTGELGGLWRHRGLPPNQLVGVGFAAQGADGGAAGYRRTPGALDGTASFLFAGVEAEVFGERGFDMGAAAGDEVDRYDVGAGSPPWGSVAASSLPLSRFYKLAVEDLQMTRENTGGDYEEDVRSDILVTEQAAGGFVFAVGSISWIQAMAVGEFDNDVARITKNALLAALERGTTREAGRR